MARMSRSAKKRGLLRTARLILRLPFRLGAVIRSYQGNAFDRKFGVDTLSQEDLSVPEPALGNSYVASDPEVVKSAIGGLGLQFAEFVFVDLGSGKGRVLLIAAGFPFKRVVGVEWSAELNRVAEQNIRNYCGPRRCAVIKSLHMDARAFPIPSEPSVFYLYAPFKAQVMGEVVNNIGKSLAGHPREVFILYVNPRQAQIFEGAEFLTRIAPKRGLDPQTTIAVYHTSPTWLHTHRSPLT